MVAGLEADAKTSSIPPLDGRAASARAEPSGVNPGVRKPPTRRATRRLPTRGRRRKRQALARPRDYYRIEDEDGHRYWVFREGLYQESELGSPGWYLHGVFG